MATGRMAFGANTSAMMFDAILHKAPTTAVRLNPQLPAELERIIDKSLEKDAALRYQTAADLLSDLKRLRRDSSSAKVGAASPRPASAAAKGNAWKLGAVAKGGTRDPEAYQLYLKGDYAWEKRTQDSLEKSKDFFNQATERDPNYAMAYLGLAEYYYVVTEYSPISNSEAMPRARAAAEKALQLDDTLAPAHAILGGVHENMFEWDESEKEFKRALDLNPDDANTHGWYAILLSQLGRSSEAIAEAKRATILEPMNLKHIDTLGVVYAHARQYGLAAEEHNKALEMDPNYAPSVNNLAGVYWSSHQYDRWLQQWRKGATLNGDKEDLAIAEEAARVYAKSGYTAAFRRTVELETDLARRRYVDRQASPTTMRCWAKRIRPSPCSRRLTQKNQTLWGTSRSNRQWITFAPIRVMRPCSRKWGYRSSCSSPKTFIRATS